LNDKIVNLKFNYKICWRRKRKE